MMFEDRGRQVYDLRRLTLAHLVGAYTPAAVSRATAHACFDVPKIVHDAVVASRLARLGAFALYANVAAPEFAADVREFARSQIHWLSSGLYSQSLLDEQAMADDTAVSQEALDLMAAACEVGAAMFHHYADLRSRLAAWSSFRRARNRHAFNNLWYEAKWSAAYADGEPVPEPPASPELAEELQAFLTEQSGLFTAGETTLVAPQAPTDFFATISSAFEETVLRYVHQVLTLWRELSSVRVFASTEKLLMLRTLFPDEFKLLETCAGRFVVARRTASFSVDEEVQQQKKYGLFQIVPDSHHNWLLKLRKARPAESFILMCRWWSITQEPFTSLTWSLIDFLVYAADEASKLELDHSVGWTNVTDWGTRTEETELEELQPLINELFPRVSSADENACEEEAEGTNFSTKPEVELSSSAMKDLDNPRAVLEEGIIAICCRSRMASCSSLRRLQIRRLLKQSVDIIPIASFTTNDQEHLASLLSLDLRDFLKQKKMARDLDFESLSQNCLLMPDCPVLEGTFYTSGGADYLQRLVEPLGRIKSSVIKVADDYSCGLLPQMASVITHIDRVLNLPLATTSGALVLNRMEILWKEVVQIWIRQFARAEDTDAGDVKVIELVIKDLRRWAVDEWKGLCASRQLKCSRRFFSRSLLKLLAFVLPLREWNDESGVAASQFIERLFRHPIDGLHVGEVLIFRHTLRALADVMPLDSPIRRTLERSYQTTQDYEEIVRKYAAEKIRPAHVEIMNTHKITRLDSRDVEQDKKSMFIKYVSIARNVKEIDAVLHTPVGTVIDQWMATLTVHSRLSMWRPELPVVDEPETEPSAMDVGVNEHLSTLATLSADFEDLLTEHSRSYVMRLVKGVREIALNIVGEDSWGIHKRIDVAAYVSQSVVKSHWLSDNKMKLWRACADFLGLEETVCDPEFLRAFDWYSLLWNLLVHFDSKIAQLERSLLSHELIRQHAVKRSVILVKEQGLVPLSDAVSDLTRMLESLSVVTEVPAVNRQTDSLSIIAELETMSLALQTLMKNPQNVAGEHFVFVISQSDFDLRLSECRSAVGLLKPQVEKFMRSQGFDDHARRKVKAKMLAVKSSADSLAQVGLQVTESNLGELVALLDAFLSGQEIACLLRSDQTPEPLDQHIADRKNQLDAIYHALVTVACVCSQLAREGMQYTQEEEDEPEAQQGNDEFVQGEGLAEGSGMKEANEELENELDFDTLAENPSPEQPKKEDNVDGKEGKEVGMDFQGELEDLPNNPAEEDDPNNNNVEERMDEVDGGETKGVEDLSPEDDMIDEGRDLREDETADAQDGDRTTEDILAALAESIDSLEKQSAEEPPAPAKEDEDPGEENGMEEDAAAEEEASPENDKEVKAEDAETEQAVDKPTDEEPTADTTLEELDPKDKDKEVEHELDVDELLDEDAVDEVADSDDENAADEAGATGDNAETECAYGEESPETGANPEEEEEKARGEKAKVIDDAAAEDELGGEADAEDAGEEGVGGEDSAPIAGGDAQERGGSSGAPEGQSTDQGEETNQANAAMSRTDEKSNTQKQSERIVKELVESMDAAEKDERPANNPNADETDIEQAEVKDDAEDVVMALGRTEDTEPQEDRPSENQTIENTDRTMENTDNMEDDEEGSADAEEIAAKPAGEFTPRRAHGDESSTEEESGGEDDSETRKTWRELEGSFERRAAQLAESLRTILVPTNKGRYQGYFRTGKRLDMRQVLSFIASDYRKDKIWLRRNRISKRNYEIILAIDNSASMKALHVHNHAIDAMIVVSMALKKLEVGKLGIVTFGDDDNDLGCNFALDCDEVLTVDKGQHILNEQLTFNQTHPDGFNKAVPGLLHFLSRYFEANDLAGMHDRRLVMVLTDGRFNQNGLQPLLDKLQCLQVCPVLLFIDPKNTIYDVKVPVFIKRANKPPNVLMKSWLDPNMLPFKSYAVLNDLENIDTAVCNIIREWLSRF